MAVGEKTLLERAETLTDMMQGAMSGAFGMMLGSQGRALLQEVAALVEDMAREIDKKGGN